MSQYQSFHNQNLPTWNENGLRKKGLKGSSPYPYIHHYTIAKSSKKLGWQGRLNNSDIVNYVRSNSKRKFEHRVRISSPPLVTKLNKDLEKPDGTASSIVGFFPASYLVGVLYGGMSLLTDKTHKDFDFKIRINDEILMVETLWKTNPPSSKKVISCAEFYLRDPYRKVLYPIFFDFIEREIQF